MIRFRHLCQLFGLGLVLLGAAQANAQIAVRFALDRMNYLQYEHIYARIELRNYSGRTVVFGETKELQGRIDFVIEPQNGDALPLAQDAPNPLMGLILKPGATESLVVPISRLYPITKVGSYTVRAIVSHRLFADDYESKNICFSVLNGMPVWERIVGVPDIMLRQEEKLVATRRARVLSFFDGIDKVYVLSVDDDRCVYGVVRLGHDIGNFPPQCEVDGISRIHVLIQISPQVFSYYLFDVNADLDEKTVHVRTDVSPQLVRDPQEGTVMVVGGRKAVLGVDYDEKNGMPVPVASPDADPDTLAAPATPVESGSPTEVPEVPAPVAPEAENPAPGDSPAPGADAENPAPVDPYPVTPVPAE